jgi:hypothetical protein
MAPATRLLIFVLLATLLIPAGAASAPRLRSSVPADDTRPEARRARADTVQVRVQVDTLGLVTGAEMADAKAAPHAGALAAVRWWVFEPARSGGRPVAATAVVPVPLAADPEPEPMRPDVLALAREAERRGAWAEALDYRLGVIGRIGDHCGLHDLWSARAEVVRVAQRMTPAPEPPTTAQRPVLGALQAMDRTLARVVSEEQRRTIDGALAIAPWHLDAYRALAMACANSGARDEAMRALRLWREGVRDSTARARATRALAALAAGDTLAAFTILQR